MRENDFNKTLHLREIERDSLQTNEKDFKADISSCRGALLTSTIIQYAFRYS